MEGSCQVTLYLKLQINNSFLALSNNVDELSFINRLNTGKKTCGYYHNSFKEMLVSLTARNCYESERSNCGTATLLIKGLKVSMILANEGLFHGSLAQQDSINAAT